MVWLLGLCRFDDNCIYAHDKTYLPPGGWWADSSILTRLRLETSVFVLTEKVGHPKMFNVLVMRTWQASDSFLLPYFVKSADGKDDKYYSDASSDEEDEDNIENSDMLHGGAEGFSLSEIEELLAQGVSPSDPDARVSLCSNVDALMAVSIAFLQHVLQALRYL